MARNATSRHVLVDKIEGVQDKNNGIMDKNGTGRVAEKRSEMERLAINSTQKADSLLQVQVQHSHFTLMNRYPDEYSLVKDCFVGRDNFDDFKVLSFGSSTGEEAISLATLYFNGAEHQNVTIYGADVDHKTLTKAKDNVDQLGSQIQRTIIFFNGKYTPISVHGKYDVIFANSVLCFHPKQLNEILAHFPFSQYEESLELLDASLKDGGLLAMVNMNYNFEETALATRYRPIGKCSGNFVPRINRSVNTFVQVVGQSMDCVWMKLF